MLQHPHLFFNIIFGHLSTFLLHIIITWSVMNNCFIIVTEHIAIIVILVTLDHNGCSLVSTISVACYTVRVINIITLHNFLSSD
jgi:hypothetical protein